jgi:hypothetical protein
MVEFEKVRALGRYSTILKGLVKKKVITQEQRKELIKELKGKVNEMSIEEINEHIKKQKGEGKRKLNDPDEDNKEYLEECKDNIKELEKAKSLILNSEIKKHIKEDILKHIEKQIIEEQRDYDYYDNSKGKSRIRKMVGEIFTNDADVEAETQVEKLMNEHEGKIPEPPKPSFINKYFWGESKKKKKEHNNEPTLQQVLERIERMEKQRNESSTSSSSSSLTEPIINNPTLLSSTEPIINNPTLLSSGVTNQTPTYNEIQHNMYQQQPPLTNPHFQPSPQQIYYQTPFQHFNQQPQIYHHQQQPQIYHHRQQQPQTPLRIQIPLQTPPQSPYYNPNQFVNQSQSTNNMNPNMVDFLLDMNN